jgi:K+-sensing histidine kinase KdpD
MISFNTAIPATFRPAPLAHVPFVELKGEDVRADRGVMVCLSADCSNFDALMHKALETAASLDSRLYLVHVETVGESVRGGAKERLRAVLERAADAYAGTEVVWIKAWDAAAALADFAREACVATIVIGRGRARQLRFHRPVCRRLLGTARHLSVEVVGFEAGV